MLTLLPSSRTENHIKAAYWIFIFRLLYNLWRLKVQRYAEGVSTALPGRLETGVSPPQPLHNDHLAGLERS